MHIRRRLKYHFDLILVLLFVGTLFHGRSLFIAVAQRKEDRQRILRDYYAQSFLQYYGSPWDVLSPGSSPSDYSFVQFPHQNPTLPDNSSQSIISQQFSRNLGVMPPFAPQNYQQSFSTFVSEPSGFYLRLISLD